MLKKDNVKTEFLLQVECSYDKYFRYLFLLCMSEDGDSGGSGGVTEVSDVADESKRMLASFGSRMCRSSHSTQSFSAPEKKITVFVNIWCVNMFRY